MMDTRVPQVGNHYVVGRKPPTLASDTRLKWLGYWIDQSSEAKRSISFSVVLEHWALLNRPGRRICSVSINDVMGSGRMYTRGPHISKDLDRHLTSGLLPSQDTTRYLWSWGLHHTMSTDTMPFGDRCGGSLSASLLLAPPPSMDSIGSNSSYSAFYPSRSGVSTHLIRFTKKICTTTSRRHV
ncbi:hypothetical protein LZ32DRAFT_307294 [Colletotrichum eremochloae]|nr:hypothetical protein LZ32DRAFT_307294 [Colletotrichum eremochloae]